MQHSVLFYRPVKALLHGLFRIQLGIVCIYLSANNAGPLCLLACKFSEIQSACSDRLHAYVMDILKNNKLMSHQKIQQAYEWCMYGYPNRAYRTTKKEKKNMQVST